MDEYKVTERVGTSPHDGAFAAWADEGVGTYGLTKREYFATVAMNGMLSATGSTWAAIPEKAVQMADALIAELNK